MTTPAATPEAPKPAGTAPPVAAAVDPDETPLAPLDPEAEIGEQIERAKEVTARAKRKEAKAKKAAETKEQKASKGKAKAEPAPAPEPETPPEPEPDPELDSPNAAVLLRARQMLERGDMDGAFKLAFGKGPEAFRLNSARWTEWRKAGDKRERDMASREERLRTTAEQVAKEYRPFAEARKLFEAEDYEGAFQKAFGVDLNSFQKRALRAHMGKDPAVEKELRAVREEREALAKERRELAQQHEQQAEAQQHRANMGAIRQNLAGSNDEQLAALASKPRFIQQVYTEFLQRTKAGEPPSMLLVVACAEDIRDGITAEFGDIFVPRDRSDIRATAPGRQNPESPHQAGKKPARPGAAQAAPSSLSQRGASEASPPPPDRLLTEEEELEQIRKFTERMKRAG